jgi:hypothetical protein
MKRTPFYVLIGSVVLIGAAGCRSAQSQATSFDQIPPTAQIARDSENSTQPAETFQVSHSTNPFASSNLSNSSSGTSIGRLPVPTTSRNPRLCTTG